ncbi:MAG: hypothetical protein PHO42_03570 [Candidatus Omnitrophica bacterium]|nr:hypothetical protein [Candidatus Omnitrophota bacterium]
MDTQQYIKTGKLCSIIQAIPESAADNNVVISIKRLSDGFMWNFTDLVFEDAVNSGPMVFTFDIFWKAEFTPPTSDTYIVSIENSNLDVKYAQILVAVSDSIPSPVVPEPGEVSAEALLAIVNQAIYARLNNGAVASYSIGGRNIQYMPLSELEALRKSLLAQTQSAKSSGRTYAKFERPI